MGARDVNKGSRKDNGNGRKNKRRFGFKSFLLFLLFPFTMLTSSRPRSHTRTKHTSPPISYQSTITPPRRPSMHWLSRSSTQSVSYAPSKPTRISEHKLVRSIELVSSQQRSGVLGSGATVVRTPDEALRETGLSFTFHGKRMDAERKSGISRTSQSTEGMSNEKRPSRDEYPQSPPLPPLPMPEDEDEELELLDPQMAAESPKSPPRPTRAPPSPPVPVPAPSLRSSLKVKSTASSDESSHVPAMPANISASPSPPPFRPILVSEVPTGAVDPSKIIVLLDTCTVTYRTTLDTLRSRPSHLSDYISSLFKLASERASVSSSVYSTASDDMSVYRHHLTSQGLLPQASFSIHLFLDRPSAPYTHILNYLRSPLASPDAPEVLPRSVHLQSSTHSRLEHLLELRDEAAYLHLDGLYKLCTDEIRLRRHDGSRLHTRGHSSTSPVGSIHSLRASVYSLHTLLERVESDIRSSQHDSSPDSKSVKDSSPSNEMVSMRSPPTPQSWNGPTLRGRNGSQRLHSPSRTPAGWI